MAKLRGFDVKMMTDIERVGQRAVSPAESVWFRLFLLKFHSPRLHSAGVPAYISGAAFVLVACGRTTKRSAMLPLEKHREDGDSRKRDVSLCLALVHFQTLPKW